MGYASDIEVLFAYDGDGRTDGLEPLSNSEYFEHLCQEIMRFIEAKEEGIFHLDVRLRPHGRKGLLACAQDELESYYSPSGLAAPLERQALIKLRWVAGSRALAVVFPVPPGAARITPMPSFSARAPCKRTPPRVCAS